MCADQHTPVDRDRLKQAASTLSVRRANVIEELRRIERQNHLTNDYEVMRPFYGMSVRLVSAAIGYGVLVDQSLASKIADFERVVGDDVESWMLHGGRLPRAFITQITQIIGHDFQYIENELKRLHRPDFWAVTKFSFQRTDRRYETILNESEQRALKQRALAAISDAVTKTGVSPERLINHVRALRALNNWGLNPNSLYLLLCMFAPAILAQALIENALIGFAGGLLALVFMRFVAPGQLSETADRVTHRKVYGVITTQQRAPFLHSLLKPMRTLLGQLSSEDERLFVESFYYSRDAGVRLASEFPSVHNTPARARQRFIDEHRVHGVVSDAPQTRIIYLLADALEVARCSGNTFEAPSYDVSLSILEKNSEGDVFK